MSWQTLNMDGKKIAVLGAGASGLVAVKQCLEEGLVPVCLERRGDIGGLWNYTDDAVENQACVMKSTVINTSKEMMPYSDFLIPKEFPNFMHNRKVLEYFNMYMDNFDLKKHIKFHTEVLSVKQCKDFTTSGKWDIEMLDIKSGNVSTEVYDGVMVCSGHHAEKRWASFPGQEDFQGEIVHTHDYKNHQGYEDKRVVVIGIGNSGGDVSVELGRICKQVFLSTRRGSWVINRIADNGIPADMALTRRFVESIKQIFPDSLFNHFAERQLNMRFDHAMYGLKPEHRFNAQHPMVNDDLPNRMACGSVVIKGDIKRITKTGVEFVDGTVEENIDVIIFATGYKFGFPFIDKSVVDVKNNVVDLYKYVFPPDLQPPTLAVVGCIQPWGAIMPISELQCRWATKVFKNEIKLPSAEDMWRDVRDKHEYMNGRYVSSPRHTIQVDWIPFMDELADHIGCKPDISSLLFTDPQLALKLFFGPCTPYQYRIMGPGKWEGARQAIMTQWDRVLAATKTRQVKQSQDSSSLLKQIVLIVILAIVLKMIIF